MRAACYLVIAAASAAQSAPPLPSYSPDVWPRHKRADREQKIGGPSSSVEPRNVRGRSLNAHTIHAHCGASGARIADGVTEACAEDAFVRSDYVMFGTHKDANSFGAQEASVPAGFITDYTHEASVPSNLGFMADFGKDGWDEPQDPGTGDYCPGGTPRPANPSWCPTAEWCRSKCPTFSGDYFTPGAPFEGWAVEFNGQAFQNAGLMRVGAQFPKEVDTTISSDGVVTWTGRYHEPHADGDLRLVQETSVYDGDSTTLGLEITVTLTNMGSTQIKDLYYTRNVDPDQEQPWTRDYSTDNSIYYHPLVPDGIKEEPDGVNRNENPFGFAAVISRGTKLPELVQIMLTADDRARPGYDVRRSATHGKRCIDQYSTYCDDGEMEFVYDEETKTVTAISTADKEDRGRHYGFDATPWSSSLGTDSVRQMWEETDSDEGFKDGRVERRDSQTYLVWRLGKAVHQYGDFGPMIYVLDPGESVELTFWYLLSFPVDERFSPPPSVPLPFLPPPLPPTPPPNSPPLEELDLSAASDITMFAGQNYLLKFLGTGARANAAVAFVSTGDRRRRLSVNCDDAAVNTGCIDLCHSGTLSCGEGIEVCPDTGAVVSVGFSTVGERTVCYSSDCPAPSTGCTWILKADLTVNVLVPSPRPSPPPAAPPIRPSPPPVCKGVFCGFLDSPPPPRPPEPPPSPPPPSPPAPPSCPPSAPLPSIPPAVPVGTPYLPPPSPHSPLPVSPPPSPSVPVPPRTPPPKSPAGAHGANSFIPSPPPPTPDPPTSPPPSPMKPPAPPQEPSLSPPPAPPDEEKALLGQTLDEAIAQAGYLWVAVGVSVGVVCCLVIVVGLLYLKRKHDRSKRVPKDQLGDFKALVDHEAMEQGDSKEALAILKVAAASVLKGGKGADLVEVVEELLRRRNQLDPALSAALAQEWSKQRPGSAAPSEHEKVELLKLMLNPTINRAPVQQELLAEKALGGWEGGGGLRAPPPKLLPYRAAPLAENVLEMAHADFKRKNFHEAQSDKEALMAFKNSLQPYAKNVLNGLKVPGEILNAAACFGADGDGEAEDTRGQLRELRDQLDKQIQMSQEETMFETPSEFRNANGNILQETMPDADCGGLRLKPPRLLPVSVLPAALPTPVIDEARALFTRINGDSTASDEECLQLMRQMMRDAVESNPGAPKRSPSGRQLLRGKSAKAVRLAPKLDLMRAAAASALDPSEEIAVGTSGFQQLSRAEVMADLYYDVDRAISSMSEFNERNELDVTAADGGYDGGGGLRVKPPKLNAPPGLQLPALPQLLEEALKQDLAKSLGNSDPEFLDIEEFGLMIVDRLEEQPPSQAPSVALQKAASSKSIGAPPKSPRQSAKSSYRVRTETLLAPGWDGGGGLRLDPIKLGPRPKKEVPLVGTTRFEEHVLNAAAAIQDAPQLYGALLGPEVLLNGMLSESKRPEHAPNGSTSRLTSTQPKMKKSIKIAHAAVKLRSDTTALQVATRAQVAPL